VDQSFLVFSDGEWNAREISHLRRQIQVQKNGTLVKEDVPLLQAKPLVVMSACQTALGKDFPAGTIGLARAWHWAGASTVVMSLWSVDDEATKELMEQFVDLVVKGQAVDKALQSAMLKLQSKYPSPSNWGSFSVYGAPERIRPIANP
jgi:CHAT domain-containing protein